MLYVWSEKATSTSTTIVDVEAEVKDADWTFNYEIIGTVDISWVGAQESQ